MKKSITNSSTFWWHSTLTNGSRDIIFTLYRAHWRHQLRKVPMKEFLSACSVERPKRQTIEGEWMGADKNSFSKELGLYPNRNSESHTNLSWYLRNKSWKARKQGGSKHERTWAINEEGWDLPGQPAQVTGSPWALQSRTGSPRHEWPDQPTPFGSPGTGDRITRDSPENCPRNRPKL
jgi:hypothetical protein